MMVAFCILALHTRIGIYLVITQMGHTFDTHKPNAHIRLRPFNTFEQMRCFLFKVAIEVPVRYCSASQ